MNFDWPKLLSEILSYAEAFAATTPSAIDNLAIALIKAALEKRYPGFGAGPGEVGFAVELLEEHREALSGMMASCENPTE